MLTAYMYVTWFALLRCDRHSIPNWKFLCLERDSIRLLLLQFQAKERIYFILCMLHILHTLFFFFFISFALFAVRWSRLVGNWHDDNKSNGKWLFCCVCVCVLFYSSFSVCVIKIQFTWVVWYTLWMNYMLNHIAEVRTSKQKVWLRFYCCCFGVSYLHWLMLISYKKRDILYWCSVS